MKLSNAKERPDGTKSPADIAISSFGYQNHVGINVGHGFIRTWKVTDAAAYEGAVLREGLLDAINTTRTVWADTAYRSAVNETFITNNGFVSRVHRKKPKGRPMPENIRRATTRNQNRSRVEHVFADQKARIGLVVRSIGIARATTKIRLVTLVYNIRRLLFIQRTAAA